MNPMSVAVAATAVALSTSGIAAATFLLAIRLRATNRILRARNRRVRARLADEIATTDQLTADLAEVVTYARNCEAWLTTDLRALPGTPHLTSED